MVTVADFGSACKERKLEMVSLHEELIFFYSVKCEVICKLNWNNIVLRNLLLYHCMSFMFIKVK